MKVTRIGKYWVDANNNKWSVSKYTQRRAQEHSASLVDCTNCINCFECVGCSDSSNLINCFFCEDTHNGFNNYGLLNRTMVSKKVAEVTTQKRIRAEKVYKENQTVLKKVPLVASLF